MAEHDDWVLLDIEIEVRLHEIAYLWVLLHRHEGLVFEVHHVELRALYDVQPLMARVIDEIDGAVDSRKKQEVLVLVHFEFGMRGSDLVDEVDDLVVHKVLKRRDFHQDAAFFAGHLERRHRVFNLRVCLLALHLQVALRCHELHLVELGVLEVVAQVENLHFSVAAPHRQIAVGEPL